jgi:hypothetical protein
VLCVAHEVVVSALQSNKTAVSMIVARPMETREVRTEHLCFRHAGIYLHPNRSVSSSICPRVGLGDSVLALLEALTTQQSYGLALRSSRAVSYELCVHSRCTITSKQSCMLCRRTILASMSLVSPRALPQIWMATSPLAIGCVLMWIVPRKTRLIGRSTDCASQWSRCGRC